jgi:flagellar basal body-associated protein FliL
LATHKSDGERDMKKGKKTIIIFGGILFALFLIALAYSLYSSFSLRFSDDFLSNIFFIQLIVFSFLAWIVIFYAFRLLFRKNKGSGQIITKIVLLSESNSLLEEFSLIKRTSVLIGKREHIYIRTEVDLTVDEYAVLNFVNNCWYVERVLDERRVGIKRAGEQFVYRLKTGMCYQLHINDIICIDNERLLVL